jgi:nucleotidyltransferase substrate binding protein (TIGR01987 family)
MMSPNIINGIDILSLLRARDAFNLFRQDMLTDRDKAGAIRAFEFCYELSWKTMKRFLAVRDLEVTTPRDAIREAAKINWIQSPEQWFDFMKKRNLAPHTYEQEIVEELLEIFDDFSGSLHEFIEAIKK